MWWLLVNTKIAGKWMFIIPQLWYCSFWLLPFFQHQLTHLMSPSTGDLPPPAVWSLTTDHLVVPSRPLWPVKKGEFSGESAKQMKVANDDPRDGKIKCQPTKQFDTSPTKFSPESICSWNRGSVMPCRSQWWQSLGPSWHSLLPVKLYTRPLQ